MKNISTNLQVNVGWQFIILLKINLLLMSLSVFNSAAIAQIFDPEILEEDCPVVSGAFFIRTYLVYVQTANDQWANALGSAELERRSRKTMEILNTVFNAHQVYFVASPPPGQDGNCYSIYTGTGYPDYSGGLTIQILSDGFAAKGVGQAGGGTLPAKYLYIGGSEDGIPASNLPVLIHEVGHCLGLAHTFRQISQGCDEISEDCEGNILPPAQQNPNYYCGCCGDYVCDTEYNDIETDSDVLVIDESCCCSTAPITGISPAIFKNFMSWSNPSRCRDRFTEGQIQRMRCYLYRASESVLEEILIAPETITGSVTWNTSQTKSTITEVLQGATLL